MLTVLQVQVLAAVSLVAMIVGFVVERLLPRQPRGILRVQAKKDPARWTEVVWIGGSLITVLWPIGILVVPAYAYHWPPSPDFPFSTMAQLVGFSVSVAGGLLFATAARALGRFMTPAIQVREGHQLVERGPYRFIRHPAYTGILASGIGLSVVYLSPILGLLVVVLVGIAYYRSSLEESLLSSPEAFGKAYTEYVARTGRFLPRVRSRH